MSKFYVMATWDDVPHLSERDKADLKASIPPYQLDARTKGVPHLGAGAIYPVPETDLLIDPFVMPEWYEYVYGMDVGWNATCAIHGARDPETDILYLWSEYYRGKAEPPIHAAAILAKGDWIPGVIDPASRGRSQNDGTQLLAQYRSLGLDNLTLADNAVEAGIYSVWTRMTTGRLKVFKTLPHWLREYRKYRRDEKGNIVKLDDHTMDAMRYLVMSGIDRASQTPTNKLIKIQPKKPKPPSDYSPFGDMWIPPQ